MTRFNTPSPSTPPSRSKGSVILPVAAGVVAIAALGFASFFYSHRAPSPMMTPTMPRPEETPPIGLATTVQAAAIRVGLGPEALVAAGVNGGALDQLFTNLAEHMLEHQAELGNADRAVDTARAATKAAQGAEAIAQAEAALESAIAARSTVLEAVRVAATANLAEGQRAAILTIRGNRSRGVPPEYAVTSRTPQEWVRLRNALADERIAQAKGEDVADSVQTLLSSVRAESAIAAARTNVANAGQNVRTTWTNAANTAANTAEAH
ncbi:MAG: hypothetical protein AB7Q00_15715 [Phycisphaerales bacterium]